MIYIGNKKSGFNLEKGVNIYVGRPTPLGNTYPLSLGRSNCIQLYRDKLKELLEKSEGARNLIDHIVGYCMNGQDVVLVCWCAPLECHGNVIRDYVYYLLRLYEEA